MSSKKSEITTPSRDARWRDALLANVPLPLWVLAMIPLGRFVENRHYVETYQARMLTLIGFNVILAVSLQLINGFSGQFSLGHAGFMAVGAYLAAYPAMHHADHYTNPAGAMLFFAALAVVATVCVAILYGLFSLCRLSKRWHPSLPLPLMLVLVAWLMVDLSRAAKYESPPATFVWSRGIAAAKDSLGSMLERGQPVAARASAALPRAAREPLSIVTMLLGGGLCAAAAGFIVGLPALRLRGDYLAIATLGAGEIIRIVIINIPALGGALQLGPVPRGVNFAWIYGTVIVSVFVVWRVAYSAAGRAIMAVREDEIAASAVGIHTTYYKVMAFVVGAFFAGVAGALFAMDQSSVGPSSFNMSRSIEIVVMVTLGGLGSISGAILAAVVLTLLPEVLRPVAEFRMVIYSLTLVVMMLVRPQGLLGGRELWPRRWSGRRASPS